LFSRIFGIFERRGSVRQWAQLIFEPSGGDWVLKPMDRDTSPIDLKLFPWGGAIFGQVFARKHTSCF
jgi:hypothetical protein